MIAMPVFNGSNFPWYNAQLQIWHNQGQQDAENKSIHDAYVDASSNYLIQYASQLAAKQPLPAIPQMPLMNVYNDDGTVSHPAFPDLTQVVAPVSTGVPSEGIAATNPPMDREDAILLLVQKIYTLVGGK